MNWRGRGALRVVATWVATATLCAGCTVRSTEPEARPQPTSAAVQSPTTASAPAFSTTTSVAAPPVNPSGVGDPYYPTSGNGGYDVAHYDVTLRANPATTTDITVQATVTATATARLDAVHLDLSGMQVDAVRWNDALAEWRRDGAELVITTPGSVEPGTPFTITVDYQGTPEPIVEADGTRLGWLRAGGASFVVSEPNGAHTWLISNDHPSDKARFTFRVDVPEGLTAAANGKLLTRVTTNGRTVWVWDANEPMATYLATVAIGRFEIIDGGVAGSEGRVAVRHVLPDARFTAPLAPTNAILDRLETLFGPFPFSQYGALVIDARLGYALETQTLALFDNATYQSTRFQVHELAHQWFGNSVTPATWRDIWLNEGFATYAEHLYNDLVDPSFDLDATMAGLARQPLPPISDPGPDGLFERSVYDRGALVLHALRRSMGDDAFFTFLRSWSATYRHKNASTEDLMRLASRTAGRDLGPLITAWLSADPMPPLR